jgi:peptide-methionine (S)-S-oxide reductase
LPNEYLSGNSGFHKHATALHQAVWSGSLEAVKALVDAGASLHLTDRIYQSTPLGWAKYMQNDCNDEVLIHKYKAIENYLEERER